MDYVPLLLFSFFLDRWSLFCAPRTKFCLRIKVRKQGPFTCLLFLLANFFQMKGERVFKSKVCKKLKPCQNSSFKEVDTNLTHCLRFASSFFKPCAALVSAGTHTNTLTPTICKFMASDMQKKKQTKKETNQYVNKHEYENGGKLLYNRVKRSGQITPFTSTPH